MTTVFSLGDDQADAFALRAEQATAPPARARVFVAGPIVTATTADAARAETDKVIALKPDLLKIRVDDNLGTSKKMPEEAWRATLDRAKAAKLTLAAHIFYLADATALAQAGGVFIAHSVRDLPVDQAVPHGDEGRQRLLLADVDARGVDVRLREHAVVGQRSVLPPRLLRRISAEISDPGRQAKFKASPG